MRTPGHWMPDEAEVLLWCPGCSSSTPIVHQCICINTLHSKSYKTFNSLLWCDQNFHQVLHVVFCMSQGVISSWNSVANHCQQSYHDLHVVLCPNLWWNFILTQDGKSLPRITSRLTCGPLLKALTKCHCETVVNLCLELHQDLPMVLYDKHSWNFILKQCSKSLLRVTSWLTCGLL